jgi:hypothetical protein
MKLTNNSFLSSYYDVIDKSKNERLQYVQYADDKKGIYHTFKFENRHKNIGIRMNTGDYILFMKRGNIELRGKNKFFRLLKIVCDRLIK